MGGLPGWLSINWNAICATPRPQGLSLLLPSLFPSSSRRIPVILPKGSLVELSLGPKGPIGTPRAQLPLPQPRASFPWLVARWSKHVGRGWRWRPSLPFPYCRKPLSPASAPQPLPYFLLSIFPLFLFHPPLSFSLPSSLPPPLPPSAFWKKRKNQCQLSA